MLSCLTCMGLWSSSVRYSKYSRNKLIIFEANSICHKLICNYRKFFWLINGHFFKLMTCPLLILMNGKQKQQQILENYKDQLKINSWRQFIVSLLFLCSENFYSVLSVCIYAVVVFSCYTVYSELSLILRLLCSL